MTAERRLTVKALTRVEGEGGLVLRTVDGRVEIAEFNIYEPPRFFERLLRGRGVREVPDIVARICGICPVAYQMAACFALEAALHVQVPHAVRRLRRLLHCGEWIQSHALHIHLLDAPDFLGCESAFSLPPEHASFLDRGLRLKATGSRIMELVGGRAVHPINVAVGGFYKPPQPAALATLAPDLAWGLEAALATVEAVSRFSFPTFTQPGVFVSLVAPDEYPFNEGRIVASDDGHTLFDVAADDFEARMVERQVPHSTALHAELVDTPTPYLCGPLARMAHCRHRLPPRARAAADACGIAWPSANPFHAIVARAIEVTAAFEEALAIVDELSHTALPACLEWQPRPGIACHAVEAPRGLLFHRYALAADGLVTEARIVPPTSQNQRRIEADLTAYLPTLGSLDDASATRRCEHLVRTFDPCISCATHFLRIERT